MPETQENIASFAAAVKRRLEQMSRDSRCTCGASSDDHVPPCARYYWSRAAWIVDQVREDERW